MELIKFLKEKESKLFYHEMIDHFTLEDINFRDKLQLEIKQLKEDLLTYRKSLDELRDVAKNEETKKICSETIAEIDLALEN